ncbi:hypothetical protein BDU57DRAFT_135379 [Ampelomyces quisqualis]|uniref:Uncharacterized protein n=1 Tax=Ampelomyces quisqualis TaxID=50730 RepID=A0A6A5QXB6_AMPQU|nr:hypothetical protein BDU57DRAFT_135379 [Ampelomyces quisqualis]
MFTTTAASVRNLAPRITFVSYHISSSPSWIFLCKHLCQNNSFVSTRSSSPRHLNYLVWRRGGYTPSRTPSLERPYLGICEPPEASCLLFTYLFILWVSESGKVGDVETLRFYQSLRFTRSTASISLGYEPRNMLVTKRTSILDGRTFAGRRQGATQQTIRRSSPTYTPLQTAY